MNLSTLFRPFEPVGAWVHPARPRISTTDAMPALTHMQRRLMAMHVQGATPSWPNAESRPRWPVVSIYCSLMFALLVIASGGWQ